MSRQKKKNGKNFSNVWFLIPARAGSSAIPRKNVRNLNGKPLIKYILDTCSKIAEKEQIIVSTDDPDVVQIAKDVSTIHHRNPENADATATLDDVACEVAKNLIHNHGASVDEILITLQPTSPFTSIQTLNNTLDQLEAGQADTVLSVKDDRHLRWKIKNGEPVSLYEERVNRQEMQPIYAETGGVNACRISTILDNEGRIGENVSLIEVGAKEGIDIDTFEDWARAEFWSKRLKIFIRVDGSPEIGFGHLYRALALAQNITSHDITFVTRSKNDYKMGYNFLREYQYPLITLDKNDSFIDLLEKHHPDIVINDILDTSESYITNIREKGIFVVNFEDLGSGSKVADIVINDLYPDFYPQKNHWYGIENAILNPNFEMESPKQSISENVSHVLVAYGGTDPNNFSRKAIQALKRINYSEELTIITGPGYMHENTLGSELENLACKVNRHHSVENMAVHMKKADLALTSAGRTVTELISLGVPTIALCQNMREMRHDHATSTYGVINMGLGKAISPSGLAEQITAYMDDRQLREDMHERMLEASRKRSNARVANRIIEAYRNNN